MSSSDFHQLGVDRHVSLWQHLLLEVFVPGELEHQGQRLSLLGGAGVTKLADATMLQDVRVLKLGDDVLVTGLVRR